MNRRDVLRITGETIKLGLSTWFDKDEIAALVSETDPSKPRVSDEAVLFHAWQYLGGIAPAQIERSILEHRQQGEHITHDILGEELIEDPTIPNHRQILEARIRTTCDDYHRLINEISGYEEFLDTFSIKLSAFGILDHDNNLVVNDVLRNVFPLFSHAKSRNREGTIDAERDLNRDRELEIIYSLHDMGCDNVGAVFQGTHDRSLYDARSFVKKIPFARGRIVKGAKYSGEKDAGRPDSEKTENVYDLAQIFLENNGRLEVATHDVDLLKRILKLVNDYTTKSHMPMVEFQILQGVNNRYNHLLGRMINNIKNLNYIVRAYMPRVTLQPEEILPGTVIAYCRRRGNEPGFIGYGILNFPFLFKRAMLNPEQFW
ncbi:MAG: proline dehydrogenase family protein [Nanoarchaeota archaeon]